LRHSPVAEKSTKNNEIKVSPIKKRKELNQNNIVDSSGGLPAHSPKRRISFEPLPETPGITSQGAINVAWKGYWVITSVTKVNLWI